MSHLAQQSNRSSLVSGVLAICLALLTGFSILNNGMEHAAIGVELHQNIELETESAGKSKWCEFISMLCLLVNSSYLPARAGQVVFPKYISKNHRLLKLVVLPSRAPPYI